jgi:hypothetical protein
MRNPTPLRIFDLDLAEGDWPHHERMRLEAGVRFHYREPFAVVLYGALARDPEVARRESARIAVIVQRAARSIRAQRREIPPWTPPGGSRDVRHTPGDGRGAHAPDVRARA